MNNAKKNPKQGEIWIANLDPTIGHEQSKTRPCLIISTDTFNFGPADLVAILPITSMDRKIPWRIQISTIESGLQKTSFVLCDQIRTISKQRLGKFPIGKINLNTLEEIKKRLKILLDL